MDKKNQNHIWWIGVLNLYIRKLKIDVEMCFYQVNQRKPDVCPMMIFYDEMMKTEL